MWRVEVETEIGISVVALLSKREAEQIGLVLGQPVAVVLEPSSIHLCPTAEGTFAETIGVAKE
jgi:molybdate transport system ATP-binding protein/molybdate/tungstate transport system ATP-binding protein